jgi:hypothetical protein
MKERRACPRFKLTPPLPGRAFVEGVGQFDAHLLNASFDGVSLQLQMNRQDELDRFLAAREKNITATFVLPEGDIWKFALLHNRATTVEAGLDCIIAARFVAVPNLTVADLDRMVSEGRARQP